MTLEPVSLSEILLALRQLGGRAEAREIKDRVTENRQGRPHGYKNERSFRETIQRVVENHCPESDNYEGRPLFRRVSHGAYELIETESSGQATPSG